MIWTHKYSKELLDNTIQTWQPLSKEPLTYTDAEEILRNTVGFFRVLMEAAGEAKREQEEERS